METLKTLANNPALLQALKEVILKEFNEDIYNGAMSNELLGQQVRARLEGKRRIEDVFYKIERYKTEANLPERNNPAR